MALYGEEAATMARIMELAGKKNHLVKKFDPYFYALVANEDYLESPIKFGSSSKVSITFPVFVPVAT